MRKFKTANCAIAFILVAALLAGCSGNGNTEAAPSVSDAVQDATDNVFSVVPVSEAALLRPVWSNSAAERTAATGVSDFAFKLSSALAEQIGGGNLICSPFSVWLPLAALVNATNDANREALLDALGAAGVTEEDMNKAASRMLYSLLKPSRTVEGSHIPMQIANAVFVDIDRTLKQDFAQLFGDYYRGSAINVDFTSPKAIRAVNNWASKNTNGRIREAVTKFDRRTVAAIANAIYFSDRWGREFDPNKTEDGTFHSPVGDETASFMLREGGGQSYYEDAAVQAMPLGFATGGGLFIILPKDGDATGLLSSMTAEYFGEMRANAENATGTLLLPRFSIDSGIMSLRDILIALGVPLFDEKSAPLTSGLIEEGNPVWLLDAVQRAFIEVDEKGTTAAAVTVMPAADIAMPGKIEPEVPFYMKCDKPFVFVLYADAGSVTVPLFTGVVNHAS
jgi:serpin B